MALKRRGLTAIFLEDMFSFQRHNPWMVLTEMFCKAGIRAFDCLAFREGFLCRHMFMSLRIFHINGLTVLQAGSYLLKLDRLVRMFLAWASRGIRSAFDIWSWSLIFFNHSSTATFLVSEEK
jgi:hypothetical protein